MLDKVAEFIQKYAPQYRDKEVIKDFIQQHLDYKTCFIGWDRFNEVAYVCRWNFNETGDTAHVLDMYIREDYRKHKVIQILLTQATLMYPSLKYICFERETKYPNREQRKYKIARILKRS